ncbi:MAG: aspartate--ammonia ligase [Treponemataceae bacterium]
MSNLTIPKNYHPLLSVKETEHAIILIKDFFQLCLSTELNLTRVTAPLFLPQGTGLNDDLNGIERAVNFPVKDMNNQCLEIVHSLAKWKRVKLLDLGLQNEFGIYADMNAIRADEELGNIHSLYVDQWDWEMVMSEQMRNISFLRKTVEKIFRCLKRTEFFIYDRYPSITPILPEKITFIHSEDLWEKYPNTTPKEREFLAAKEFGAIFIHGIGAKLPDGSYHDGRAPDYDDWITKVDEKHYGLNGDLIVWNPILQTSLELSSMGIRVSPQSLLKQLDERGCPERKSLYFHKRLLNGELPFSIGGGIGQSRLCMYFLRKAHIGETQVSVWPQEMIEECKKNNISLL